MDEAGLPGFYVSFWHGLWAPRGTPKEIVATINAARSLKWEEINSAVWEAIGERDDHELTLADVDEIAKISSTDSNEVLALLALISRPAAGLLKMEYFPEDGAESASVSTEEVTKNLRAWWREKTISDDVWQSWAGKIVVKWLPLT